jgi:hypothetical protein
MSAGLRPGAAPEPWLEIIDAPSPLLLLAPHGGRAGRASRATPNPKINDLHTAEITRELARRLRACALINSGMDRNHLDCNRISQLAERAPWLLDLIAARVARMAAEYGHATVLLIHGWNIIEPRVDFGVGARASAGELRAAGSAHLSASDDFINGPLRMLAARLRAAGIQPTFGMRYPAGGIHNLVQAFTARRRGAPIDALDELAAIAATGSVDAAQLELSVAVRMPGPLRERAIDAIVATLDGSAASRESPASPLIINRMPRARPAAPRHPASAAAPALPARIGIEFFDPDGVIGAIASFDIGPGGAGARIMLLIGQRRAVLFTAEGKPVREEGRIALGPLALTVERSELMLEFRGPAVVVPDSASYVSIERALASARLDPSLEISARMKPREGDPQSLLADFAAPGQNRSAASFGILEGDITSEGVRWPVRAVARAGLSLSGSGPQRFRSRRMIWACFDDGALPAAVELRAIASDVAPDYRSARVLDGAEWHDGEVGAIDIDAAGVDLPPGRIGATLTSGDGDAREISGEMASFVLLSRPGPERHRIYTALGFANFRMDERTGAGMFEYSRVLETSVAAGPAADSESD